MGLALTNSKPVKGNREEQYRALFDNLIKEDMRESWEKIWKNWFCTAETVEDDRTPGKLKCKT